MGVVEFFRAMGLMLGLVVIGSIVTLLDVLLYPFLLCFDKRWVVPHRLIVGGARLISQLFINVEARGFEHVPKDMRRTIIVVNHQSTLDVAALSVLRSLDFYVIFKASLLWVPGMGTSMWLANYLPVNRTDRDSKKALLRRATDGLRSGDNQLWFPEGTRAQATMMGEFKPGAFLVGHDAGADILPVTISGARRLMPAKGLPQLRTGHVIVTIHPVIKHDAGRSVDATIALARAAIATALRPEIDMPSGGAKAAAVAAEGGIAGVTGSGAALVATASASASSAAAAAAAASSPSDAAASSPSASAEAKKDD